MSFLSLIYTVLSVLSKETRLGQAAASLVDLEEVPDSSSSPRRVSFFFWGGGGGGGG